MDPRSGLAKKGVLPLAMFLVLCATSWSCDGRQHKPIRIFAQEARSAPVTIASVDGLYHMSDLLAYAERTTALQVWAMGDVKELEKATVEIRCGTSLFQADLQPLFLDILVCAGLDAHHRDDRLVIEIPARKRIRDISVECVGAPYSRGAESGTIVRQSRGGTFYMVVRPTAHPDSSSQTSWE